MYDAPEPEATLVELPERLMYFVCLAGNVPGTVFGVAGTDGRVPVMTWLPMELSDKVLLLERSQFKEMPDKLDGKIWATAGLVARHVLEFEPMEKVKVIMGMTAAKPLPAARTSELWRRHRARCRRGSRHRARWHVLIHMHEPWPMCMAGCDAQHAPPPFFFR